MEAKGEELLLVGNEPNKLVAVVAVAAEEEAPNPAKGDGAEDGVEDEDDANPNKGVDDADDEGAPNAGVDAADDEGAPNVGVEAPDAKGAPNVGVEDADDEGAPNVGVEAADEPNSEGNELGFEEDEKGDGDEDDANANGDVDEEFVKENPDIVDASLSLPVSNLKWEKEEGLWSRFLFRRSSCNELIFFFHFVSSNTRLVVFQVG